jgi:hypothetical protein
MYKSNAEVVTARMKERGDERSNDRRKREIKISNYKSSI